MPAVLVRLIIAKALEAITPMLKQQLMDLLQDFRRHAYSTTNPYDDMVANFIADILELPDLD